MLHIRAPAGVFPTVVIAGTTTIEFERAKRGCGYPADPIYVPLLSVNQSLQALRSVPKAAQLLEQSEFRALVGELGGLPRLLDAFAAECAYSRSTSALSGTAVDVFRSRLRTKALSFYSSRTLELTQADADFVVCHALTNWPVHSDRHATCLRWEAEGRVMTAVSGGGLRIEMPFVLLVPFFEASSFSGAAHPVAQLMHVAGGDAAWSSWEKLNMLYEAARSALLRHLLGPSVSVREFYRGALLSFAEDFTLVLTAEEMAEARHRWPECGEDPEPSPFEITRAFRVAQHVWCGL